MISSFGEVCAEKNKTIRFCRDHGSMTLEELACAQADKVLRNRRRAPLLDPEDFFRRTGERARELLGEEAGLQVEEAVRYGAICTADHHGGIFYSQTLQGDLLFGEVLKKLGYQGTYIPIHSGGQVELGNVTYARGICAWTESDRKLLFPVFSVKHRSTLASFAPPVDEDMLGRFRAREIPRVRDPQLRRVLMEINGEILGAPEVLKASRYADQVTLAGRELSRRIFHGSGAPLLAYLELEEVLRPILIRELKEGSSLLCSLLFDPAQRTRLGQLAAREGVPLSSLFFLGGDPKGRSVLLELTKEGQLYGRDLKEYEYRYEADADTLCELLNERVILPGFFLIAVLLFFERGVTFLGGYFQSLYLPTWQSLLVRLLKETGREKEADLCAAYDCSGYVCGPMFALYRGEGFSTPAGPVELMLHRPKWQTLRATMNKTALWDAHLMGMSEMYCDLVPPGERAEGYYAAISAELSGMFPENEVGSPVHKGAWAEVDTGGMAHNLRVIRRNVKPGTAVCGVLKADAYGHGLCGIKTRLAREGSLDMVAVGKLLEMKKLFGETPDDGLRILLLGSAEADEVTEGYERRTLSPERAVFSLYNIRQYQEFNALGIRLGIRIPVHVRLDAWDTGMGLGYGEFCRVMDGLFEAEGLDVCGLYSHLYNSYTGNEEVIQDELEKFSRLVESLSPERRKRLTVHILNSVLVFRFPEYAFDMVRTGTALYGLPCADKGQLRTVMRICARVFDVRTIDAAAPLSYESDPVPEGTRRIARIMVGYWDCPLLLTREVIRVSIRGRLYPLADDVCMDNLCIDITGCDEIVPGDVAVLLGEAGVTVEEVLERNDISYVHSEWLSMTAGRLEKVYI